MKKDVISVKKKVISFLGDEITIESINLLDLYEIVKDKYNNDFHKFFTEILKKNFGLNEQEADIVLGNYKYGLDLDYSQPKEFIALIYCLTIEDNPIEIITASTEKVKVDITNLEELRKILIATHLPKSNNEDVYHQLDILSYDKIFSILESLEGLENENELKKEKNVPKRKSKKEQDEYEYEDEDEYEYYYIDETIKLPPKRKKYATKYL